MLCSYVHNTVVKHLNRLVYEWQEMLLETLVARDRALYPNEVHDIISEQSILVIFVVKLKNVLHKVGARLIHKHS